MLTLDQLAEIVDTPGRLMGLYEKHGLKPMATYGVIQDGGCCALGIVAIEIGEQYWNQVLGDDSELTGFYEGFDGECLRPRRNPYAYELGRRARIACGLEGVKP